MASFDLGSIPAKEVPEKTETIKFYGKDIAVKIKPIVGEARIKVYALDALTADKSDEEAIFSKTKLIIKHGADMTDNEVEELLCKHGGWEFALNLAGLIWSFTAEWEKELFDLSEQAEKNLKAEAGSEQHTGD